jgi:transglutaminase-like putative cysteine protease
MKLLTVRHSTTYRYSDQVRFGEHRLMMRPRDSHDLRVVRSELTLSPPGTLRWLHDVFGNSVTVVDFGEPAAELHVVSTLFLERYALDRPDFSIAPDAETYPFVYSAGDRTDLGRLLERHYPDPKDIVGDWARRFMHAERADTLELLATMNASIKSDFAYRQREEEGTQSPLETLDRKSGSCRDFALLLMEAVRSLGFGARFVTGYYYDPSLESGGDNPDGTAATHAWAEIYLPGAGWIEYDPTNGLVAGANLIRVAVTRDPSQAIPIAGSFIGDGANFLGMDVEVKVTSQSGGPPLAPA